MAICGDVVFPRLGFDSGNIHYTGKIRYLEANIVRRARNLYMESIAGPSNAERGEVVNDFSILSKTNICRVCLMTNVATVQMDMCVGVGGRSTPIISLLRNMSKAEVVLNALEKKEFPQQVCLKCAQKLTVAYEFINELEISQEKLMRIWSNNNKSLKIKREQIKNCEIIDISEDILKFEHQQSNDQKEAITKDHIICNDCNISFHKDDLFEHVSGNCHMIENRKLKYGHMENNIIVCKWCKNILYACERGDHSETCTKINIGVPLEPTVKNIVISNEGNIPVIDLTEWDEAANEINYIVQQNKEQIEENSQTENYNNMTENHCETNLCENSFNEIRSIEVNNNVDNNLNIQLNAEDNTIEQKQAENNLPEVIQSKEDLVNLDTRKRKHCEREDDISKTVIVTVEDHELLVTLEDHKTILDKTKNQCTTCLKAFTICAIKPHENAKDNEKLETSGYNTRGKNKVHIRQLPLHKKKIEPIDETYPYKCAMCPKIYKRQYYLDRHFRVSHVVTIPTQSPS